MTGEQIMQSDAVPPPAPRGRSGNATALAGFLAAAIGLVGLAGMFASYIAPLPYERALRRDAVLDQLQTTPATDTGALRDQLGDSADAVLGADPAHPLGRGQVLLRIPAERLAMRQRLQADADFTGTRLRSLIGLITLLAAAMGATMLGLRARLVD